MEIRYKVVRLHPSKNGGEYRSVIIPPHAITSIVYEIGKVAEIPKVCVDAGYYPTLFADMYSLSKFHDPTNTKFLTDAVLECEVEEPVIPLPPRLQAGWASDINKRIPSQYSWPEGTEMWKKVTPICAISNQELEELLKDL